MVGTAAGLGLFSTLRGLFFPPTWTLWFLIGCLLSLAVALWCGIVRQGIAEPDPQ